MLRSCLVGLLVLLLVSAFMGCAKIVFAPELQKEIDKLGENPAILVLGEKGQVLALTRDGQLFEKCYPMDKQTADRDCGPCKGLTKDAKIISEGTIKIINSQINPYCKIVIGPDGRYQEKCLPFPW
ncbi:MAG: hypothetical protein WAU91_21325 [Desulfatitalea sp.]